MDQQQYEGTNRTTKGIYEELMDEIGKVIKKGLNLQDRKTGDESKDVDSDNLSITREVDEPQNIEVASAKRADARQNIEVSHDEVAPKSRVAEDEVEKSSAKKASPEARGLLFKNSGFNKIDKLTKEDAAAIAAMLQGKVGENIPGAANLKVMVNGKVLAQADADGNLTTVNQAPKLAKTFSDMAQEPKRISTANSEGVQQVAAISKESKAPGHMFMQRILKNFQAQKSADMPVVNQELTTSSNVADADSIINLYATKEPNQENYQLKDGGQIIARPGTEDQKDYQFYEVQDASGNIDMAFSVSPDGMIIADPKISTKLQEQIALMEEAWNKGEYNDDTPLMTKDKARAEALGTFTKNVSEGKSSDLTLDIKTDKNGKVTATSKADPKAKIVMAPNPGGRMRVLSNSFGTQDLQDFNHAFAIQTREKGETNLEKEERTTATAVKKKTVTKKAPAKRKSKGMTQ